KWVVVITTTVAGEDTSTPRKFHNQNFSAGVFSGEAASWARETSWGLSASSHHTHRRVTALNRRWNYCCKKAYFIGNNCGLSTEQRSGSEWTTLLCKSRREFALQKLSGGAFGNILNDADRFGTFVISKF